MEEAHRQLGDVEHIRDERNEVRERVRRLKQEIDEFAVRPSFS